MSRPSALDTIALLGKATMPIDDSIELWRDIPESFGYQISNWGRVRTCTPRNGKGPLMDEWRFVKTLGDKKYGHHYVHFRIDGKQYFRKVSRLVMGAFVGLCPSGMEVCHIDHNPGNNRLSNLKYDTHLANVRDSIAAGRYRCGERSPNAKLTQDDVLEIRSLISLGMTQDRIAARFRIHQKTVSQIVRRERWAHLC